MTNHLINSNSSVAVRIQGLSKCYRLYRRVSDRLLQVLRPGKRYYAEKHALRPLDLTVYKGETLGIVGANGSGKSTLLQLICGTLTPTSGTCETYGRIAALLELGAGFSPEFTGDENIHLNAAILGLSREEIAAKYDAIVAFSGLGEAVHQLVKTYSSGMYVRLGFAVASAVDPDIFIIDEALAVGDERFQRKCYSRIKAMKEAGKTIIFVSHSANSVLDICDRAILLDRGELLLDGSPKYVLNQYHHLMYASEAKREAIRQAIKNHVTGAQEEEALPSTTGQFVADMQPETTLVHEAKGAVIEQFALLAADGQPANLLHQRAHYCQEFTVRFTESCQQVRFQYIIQKQNGIIVHSSNSRHADAKLMEVAAGSRYKVRFRFHCLLLPGYYYMTLNCSGLLHGENAPLARITDALMFRVLPDTTIQAGGVVDLMSEASVELC